MDNGAEYQADLKIFCHDRPGLLVDITKIFTEKEINISGIQSKTSKQGIATIEVFFNIRGRDQIKVLVEKLRQIEEYRRREDHRLNPGGSCVKHNI